MTNAAQNGNLCAGNSYIRFGEVKVASEKPRCGSLFNRERALTGACSRKGLRRLAAVLVFFSILPSMASITDSDIQEITVDGDYVNSNIRLASITSVAGMDTASYFQKCNVNAKVPAGWQASVRISYARSGTVETLSERSILYVVVGSMTYSCSEDGYLDLVLKESTKLKFYLHSLSSFSSFCAGHASLKVTYAKVPAYVITYKPGAYGTGTEQKDEKYEGTTLMLKGAIFKRAGYTQKGWATADGGGKAYDLWASYSANRSQVLYPYWEKNAAVEIEVRFHENHPSGTVDKSLTRTYVVGEKYGTFPTFSVDGYTFQGYFTAQTGGSQYYETSTVSSSVKDLYAHWKANQQTAKPDLSFSYTPSGWSGSLVTSASSSSTTGSSTFKTTDTIYVHWAVICRDKSVTTSFKTDLYVDGTLKTTFTTDPLAMDSYTYNASAYSIGKLSAGSHTIKIVTDSGNVVSESNESNNTHSKAITVIADEGDRHETDISVSVSASGGTKNVKLATKSGVSYKFDCTTRPDWVTGLKIIDGSNTMTIGFGTTTYGGMNDGQSLSFTVAANTTPSSRSWTLCVYKGAEVFHRVKIMQDSGTPTTYTVSISGASSVTSGNTATYTCTASYSSGSSAKVVPTWSISSGSSYASISSSGVLTAKSVTSSQSVMILASYTLGGVTKTATKTVTVNPVPVTLSSISISGTSSVSSGNTSTYTCTASYSDGSSSSVTPTWSIGSGSSYASISSSGVLTAKSVTSSQSVTIQASYTSGGVTKTATKTVTVNPATSSKTLSSISISGSSSVTSGNTSTYACTASYSDGSSSSVTPTWSIYSGGSYASISSSGVLTAKSVTSSQSVTIQASYTSGGVTKTATKTVTINPQSSAPVNDNFANATVISGSSGSTTGSNVGATSQSGEPLVTSYSSATKTVWWKWTAPTSGIVTIDTIGSSFDTQMGIYTGSSLSSLSLKAKDDDGGSSMTSKCTFDCTSGTTYYICVGGYSGASGSIKLNWNVTTSSKTLSSISISGSSSVEEHDGRTYTCTAYYFDGSSSTVTPTWSISSGSSYARIGDSGWLYAYKVTVWHVVTIKASYTEGGVTKTATKKVTINPDSESLGRIAGTAVGSAAVVGVVGVAGHFIGQAVSDANGKKKGNISREEFKAMTLSVPALDDSNVVYQNKLVYHPAKGTVTGKVVLTVQKGNRTQKIRAKAKGTLKDGVITGTLDAKDLGVLEFVMKSGASGTKKEKITRKQFKAMTLSVPDLDNSNVVYQNKLIYHPAKGTVTGRIVLTVQKGNRTKKIRAKAKGTLKNGVITGTLDAKGLGTFDFTVK